MEFFHPELVGPGGACAAYPGPQFPIQLLFPTVYLLEQKHMSGQLGGSRGHSKWRRSQTLSRLSLRDEGPVGTYLFAGELKYCTCPQA